MTDKREIDIWVRPRQLFNNGRLVTDAAIGIAEGDVVAITEAHELPKTVATKDFDGIISPGFVDLQVNGGGGVLLNETPTKKAMTEISRAHRTFGTTSILPTLITDTAQVLAKAVDAAIVAHGQEGIQGLHIEGPHICLDRRGTHNVNFVRPIDEHTIEQVTKLRAADVPTLITLAPDVVAPEYIKRITELGAVVSIGHSKANSSITKDALLAGATCFTHLFNAMPPMTGREPGVVGTAINSNAYVGIICDGIHVEDEMVGLVIRARPVADRTFIVSDAMPTVGGPQEFNLYGTIIRLEGRRLVNSEGSLAGAHTTQSEGVKRLVQNVRLAPEEALRMAITVPSNAIGLRLDQIQGRNVQDLICLDYNLEFLGFLTSILSLENI